MFSREIALQIAAREGRNQELKNNDNNNNMTLKTF